MRFAVLLAALALCGVAPSPDFAYDGSAPVRVVRTAASADDGVETTRIRFRSGTRDVAAAVVRPPGGGTHPGILFVHWLGDPATSNLSEFMPDATALAKRGAVCVLVDAMWAQDKWFTDVRSPDTDYADSVAQVVALRRALSVLLAEPGVDPSRIAYVGHDFGAMYGAVLAGVDRRANYYVFMTPTVDFWDWYLLGKTPADSAAYVERMSAFDLPRWLPRAAMAATLLQFADNDEYVARSTAISFRNIVPARDRTMKRYDTDHALKNETATADRRAWLAAHLRLP